MGQNPPESQDVTVIVLENQSLNTRTVQKLKQNLQPLIQPNARVVLDLGRVWHVDSAGVGAMLSFRRQISDVGGDVKLSSMAKPVRILFQQMRMHRVFDIFNGKEEAVNSYRQ